MNLRLVIGSVLILCCAFGQSIFAQNGTLKTGEIRGTMFEGNGTNQNQRKSVLVAVGMSLVLPGMGELYVGKFETGKYHLLAEGGIWLGYIGMKSYSDWIRDDAQSFAAQHAAAQFSGKDSQFDVNVGDYNSLREYNEAMLKNRNTRLLYELQSHSWEWDNESNRLRFRDLRITSDRTRENATFLIGAAVLNRIVSAFSAGRSAARTNAAGSDSWNLQSGYIPHTLGGQSLVVRFSTPF